MSRTTPVTHLNPAKSAPDCPTRAEAEAAVRTLLAWAGDNPDRDELHDTPRRVVEAYEEYFRGYREDPMDWLSDAEIDMAGGYDDIIMLNGVRVQSFCEHHLTPFEGSASLAYLPDRQVVGLSRLARVVDTFARRLQTQEQLTEQITRALEEGLKPRGVAVLIEAEHQCISFRGLRQTGIKTITTRFCGAFDTDQDLRDRFLQLTRTTPHSK